MTTIFKKARRELEEERDRLEERSLELRELENRLSKERRDFECESAELDRSAVRELPRELISPNPYQPRTAFPEESLLSLADSIRQHGFLQPLVVRKRRDGFELIAGERRLRAANLLSLDLVPCIVIDADDRKSAELAIIENLQREDLSIFDQAGSIAALIDMYSLTQEEAARRLAVSQSFVANKLRLLRLSEAERTLVLENRLTERHARAVLRLDESSERLAALSHIASRGLNVAAAEAYVERLLAERASARAPKRFVLKDIRIFYNSIDKALTLVKEAGVEVERSLDEREDASVLTITIRKG